MAPTNITRIESLTWLDWLVLFGYFSSLVAISVYQSRKLRAQDDYFLAGRSMSRWPVAISIFVALFSTNSLVGVIGWVNRQDGTVWISLSSIGAMLSVPLVIMLYPKIFFRLRITTAYEYLEKRFNYVVRASAALFFMCARIMWMATMLYATSLVVVPMLGWSGRRGSLPGDTMALLLVGAAGTFLALVGGMRGVIWTDVLQFFVLFGGTLIMAAKAALETGGLRSIAEFGVTAGKFSLPPLFISTQDLTLLSGLSMGFFGYLSNAGADQMVLQTYMAAKSETEAKKSLIRNGLLLKPFSLIFPLVGVTLAAYYARHPAHASMMTIPDDALPIFVTQVMPAGVRSLILAAIFSAVLTSLASGLTALSACAQIDFVRRWRKKPLSDAASVLMARGLTLTWGLLIIGGACAVRRLGQSNSIIVILTMVIYPFSGVLLGIFLLGLLTRRANSIGVLAGAGTGLVFLIGLQLLKRGIGATLLALVPRELAQFALSLSRLSPFFYGGIGALTTFGVGYLVSQCSKAPALEKLVGLSHGAPAPPAEPPPSLIKQ